MKRDKAGESGSCSFGVASILLTIQIHTGDKDRCNRPCCRHVHHPHTGATTRAPHENPPCSRLFALQSPPGRRGWFEDLRTVLCRYPFCPQTGNWFPKTLDRRQPVRFRTVYGGVGTDLDRRFDPSRPTAFQSGATSMVLPGVCRPKVLQLRSRYCVSCSIDHHRRRRHHPDFSGTTYASNLLESQLCQLLQALSEYGARLRTVSSSHFERCAVSYSTISDKMDAISPPMFSIAQPI